MTIKSVGVIGAGQMGNGIAHVFALAGYDVTLTDADPECTRRVSTRTKVRRSFGKCEMLRVLIS